MTKPKPAAANGTTGEPAITNGTTLTQAVQATINGLETKPADSALVKLALVLAKSIDEMSDELRGRMLAQTTPQLLATLRELRIHAPAKMPSWSEQHPKWAAQR